MANYIKPRARDLGALSAAEGYCYAGGTATSSTCTKGITTYTCKNGITATYVPPSRGCGTGADAANCSSGSAAGG